jgi:hypothetical protein
MKHNKLWYFSPIAFALLSITWMSQATTSIGGFHPAEAGRTIQGEMSTPGQNALKSHCNGTEAFDENTLSPARHMKMVRSCD